MELQLLGPVQAAADGRQVNLGVRMQRFVLAVLALEANQLVTTERLIDLAWPEDPPRTARRIIQTQISRLRGTLAAAGVDEVFSVCPAGPGYRLRCEPDCVDAHRFTSLLGRAGCAADDEVRIGLLSEALALWQGPALADTVTEATRALLCGHLDEARLTAMADRLDALLRQGDQQTVIHEAGGLAVRHPDRFTGHIMLALHHAGRTAEALAAYRQAKQRLEDEFGLDPPATLRRLELRILRDRPDLNPPQKRRQSAIRLCRPAQLPADLPMFTGRAGELARLNAWLAHNGCVPTAAVICAINGMPGVGKTALAVHWAHLVAGRFPDGTLYVNLRGVDPSKPAMSPAEAVRGFLDAFEVPPHRIPADPDSQVGMYRSLLAGRRVLVVLDNAHDTEQVRPLLPGSPTCLTVVTSRNQLTGLAAAQSAKILALDPLTEDHARELLTDRIGPQRVAAEPNAVADIITRCAGLPLALAIVAARAALHPHFPLAALAAGLAHSQLNDPDSDIRHFFSWSYRSLTPPAARLFRLLGLHPGPDTSPSAAASLVAVPVGEILPLLAELTRNNLLIEHVPGRFTFHDLLRDYACHLAQDFEPEVPRHAATHRLLDHYLHTAHAAAVLLNPHLEPVALTPPQPSVTPETLTSYEQAQAWFTTEHRVLLAAIDHAAATGWDTHTLELAQILLYFLDWRGHWHDLAATQRAAEAAAARSAEPTMQANAYHGLALACTRLGQFDDAQTNLMHALDLYRRGGDQAGQARTHRLLAMLWGKRGDNAEALHHAQQTLTLYRTVGHRRGQALALNAIGWCRAQLGEHQLALATCTRALALLEKLNDHIGQAATLDSLGYAYHHLAQPAQAITCYQRAIGLRHELGDRDGEADSLVKLGDIQYGAADHDAARHTWQTALNILRELDRPEADAVNAKLHGLTAKDRA